MVFKQRYVNVLFSMLSIGAFVLASFNKQVRVNAENEQPSTMLVSKNKETDVINEAERIPVVIPKEEPILELDPSIYNVELMEANGIEPFDASNYAKVEDVIYELIQEFNVNTENIGLAYYDFNQREDFHINANNYMIAASTSKTAVGALYIDLINEGKYSFESHLPFNEAYLVEGAGTITNSPLQASYSISDLLFESIAYSDNTAWYILAINYINNFQTVRQGILDLVNFSQNVPEIYYADNYTSAALSLEVLKKIATDPAYEHIISIMKQTQPQQLFTSYVYPENMATKFGRLEQKVHDTGIYYENDQPQYALVVLTDNVSYADGFIELLNLRINQWYRATHL